MAKTTTDSKKKKVYKAITRYLIVSPYKIRPVANLIRRKPYTEAVSILENMPHKGARLIRKTVVSPHPMPSTGTSSWSRICSI